MIFGGHQFNVALLVPDMELNCFGFPEKNIEAKRVVAFYPGLGLPSSGDCSPFAK